METSIWLDHITRLILNHTQFQAQLRRDKPADGKSILPLVSPVEPGFLSQRLLLQDQLTGAREMLLMLMPGMPLSHTNHHPHLETEFHAFGTPLPPLTCGE